jgi:hypothetical protein
MSTPDWPKRRKIHTQATPATKFDMPDYFNSWQPLDALSTGATSSYNLGSRFTPINKRSNKRTWEDDSGEAGEQTGTLLFRAQKEVISTASSSASENGLPTRAHTRTISYGMVISTAEALIANVAAANKAAGAAKREDNARKKALKAAAGAQDAAGAGSLFT